MSFKQNDREYLQDMVQREVMSADQANVEKVKMARVQLVVRSLPAQVRKALNDAVKRGELARMKKDGRKPEAYYHPTFEHLAKQERNEYERNTLKALASVIARPTLID